MNDLTPTRRRDREDRKGARSRSQDQGRRPGKRAGAAGAAPALPLDLALFLRTRSYIMPPGIHTNRHGEALLRLKLGSAMLSLVICASLILSLAPRL